MFYNAIGNCPCKNTCEMREINCHSKCNAYLDWPKKQEEFKEKYNTTLEDFEIIPVEEI